MLLAIINWYDKYLLIFIKGSVKGKLDRQPNKNKGSNSKLSIKYKKYANYHIQQGIRERKMNSSNTIELTTMVVAVSSIYIYITSKFTRASRKNLISKKL